ncbi:glucose-6-phosphate isomerase [Campylobacter sp. MG1]|uniref:glucose-6-phosphate isomerase n=1 Tax=Campylobacter sp. MG1 TaxID=2976332 RepID=UPI00226D22DC|nr:glucose-6-phosphate isomerase [Campylobacter sp. MG1]
MLEFNEYFEPNSLDTINSYAKRMNEEKQSGEVGFYHLPLEFDNLLKELKTCKKHFENKNYFIVIGVGGSSLGTKAISNFLQCENIDFLDNISTINLNKIIKKINLEKTLFILASKSGNTVESISYFRILVECFNINLNDLHKYFVTICMKDTELYKFSIENNIKNFLINSNVSGRFSVLSAIGIVPLYFAGIDVLEIMNGARACLEDENISEHILNLAYTLTTKMINKNYVLFTYCEELRYFNEWFVQLVAESLGKFKEYKRVGLTPISLIGSKDQHSFLQLIMEGPKDKFVQFIRIKPNNNSYKIPHLQGFETLENISIGYTLDELLFNQAKSCLNAIVAEKIDASEITLDEVNAYNIGYLIYYYELLVSACGLMMGINTYNQPGVESAKIHLKMLLKK